jgi:hypothetical protein
MVWTLALGIPFRSWDCHRSPILSENGQQRSRFEQPGVLAVQEYHV